MAVGNKHPSTPHSRHSSTRGSVLPLYQSQTQFRPRSTLAHREDLGRQAVRQARNDRMGRMAGGGGEDSSDMTSSEDLEMERVHSDEGGLLDDEESGMSAAERVKLRRQKKRRRRMPERGAAGGDGSDYNLSKQEERIANRLVLKNLAINAMFIGLWYLFSISISLKPAGSGDEGENAPNRRRADGTEKKDDGNVFPYPLFTTSAHMLVQFSLAALVMFIFPRFRPRNDSLGTSSEGGNERLDQHGDKKPVMTWWFYMTRIAPCALATGTDIGLGNKSLETITLTFYTMCKSSVLGFVLTFAFLFRLEKPTWKLCGIIAGMTGGVIMMVAGETKFDGLGFALVMTAAASSGFRWSLTQILLLRNPATSNPFASIFYLAPVMFLVLFIMAVPIEKPHNVLEGLHRLFEAHGVFPSIVLLIFPGCLAFCMVSSEFALLQRSSVVTLSVAGIFKEVVTISAASLVFKDQLTTINISGVLVTIACIGLYNWMKISKMRSEARMDAHLSNADYQPVLGADDEPGAHANGHSKSPDALDSTARLLRNSLSVGSEGRASPSKRPEDHD